MRRNSREQQIRAARRLLGDERLLAFLRAVRDDTGVFAVKLINEDLDQGQDLNRIFYTGDEFGFLLSVKQRSDVEFDISFGCQAGPLAGDGCRWLVAFDGDVVRSLEPQECWIS